jgi:F0F1-type ATP synthase membrane subunit b/b'
MHRLTSWFVTGILFAWPFAAGAQQHEGPHAPEPAAADHMAEEAGSAHEGGDAHHMPVGSFVLIQVLGVAVVGWVYLKFVGPAIRSGMDARAGRIRDAFAKAEADSLEVDRQLTEHRDKLAGFNLEARRRREAALRDAQALRAQAEEDARGQSAALIEKAVREGALERARVRIEIRETVIERAFDEAARKLRQRADDRFHGTLVERTVAELQSLPPLL